MNLDLLIFFQAPGQLHFQIDILVRKPVTGTLEFKLGVYPRQDDGRAEGLGDVIHRAEFEALLFVFDRIQPGDENDRNILGGRILAQAGEYIVAVHAGHQHVEQDQIGFRGAGGDLQCALPGRRGQYIVMRLEQAAESIQIAGVVVHHQDSCPGHLYPLVCVHALFPPRRRIYCTANSVCSTRTRFRVAKASG